MYQSVTTTTAEKRRLIAAMDDYSLLGLSRLGTVEERSMAAAEIELREVTLPPRDGVLGLSSQLVAACDRLDAVDGVLAMDAAIEADQAFDARCRRVDREPWS